MSQAGGMEKVTERGEVGWGPAAGHRVPARSSGTALLQPREPVTSSQGRGSPSLRPSCKQEDNTHLFLFFKDQFWVFLSPKNACKAAVTCVCYGSTCWNEVSRGEAAPLPEGTAGDTVCSHSHRRIFIDTDVSLAAGFKLDFFYFIFFYSLSSFASLLCSSKQC